MLGPRLGSEGQMLRRAVLREARRGFATLKRPTVVFQSDYDVLSAQFAGLLIAEREKYFFEKGIDVVARARVRPGSEADVVVAVQETAKRLGASVVALGCTEQNIVVPAQALGTPVTAVSAMLQSSPLALGALPSSGFKSLGDIKGTVGMLADSIPLASRLLEAANPSGKWTFVEVTNENKVGLLAQGKLDAIQIYDATEPYEMKHATGVEPTVLTLGKLGYAQVIFGESSAMQTEEGEEMTHAFLSGLYQGWKAALAHPEATAQYIVTRRLEAAGVSSARDFHDTPEYQAWVLNRLKAYVNPAGKFIGAIEPQVWSEATDRMVQAGYIAQAPAPAKSLNTHIWPASAH